VNALQAVNAMFEPDGSTPTATASLISYKRATREKE
jgi:hypothetical protein